ncbi:MAG: serine/threonine protein kinase [Acidobacteria bacterium]|nr:MAG: serine/threonine protein kinase [Acidobacteriota bacterium]
MGADGVDHIGPYRVVERLGVGGMGEVYKAFDDRLDRWVAIKRIRPDKEEAEEHRERFRREARAAAKLNHAAIVHIYDIFQDGDSDCIVMELVEGKSLDRMIAEGPLDPYRAAELARQIASGLAEAHEKGILHRDLKAENIIVTDGERSKILDFGLAKPLIKGDLDTSLTGKGQVVGTSRAMSPEYVSGDEVDHRSDLFALGVLLYESVTGQSPFKAHNTLATLKRVILHRQTPAAEINPAVPLELSQFIDRLLEKEPEDRPQSAREVAEILGHLTGRSSSSEALDRAIFASPTASTQVARLRRPLSAYRWWMLAAALFLVLGTAGGYVAWQRAEPAASAPLEAAETPAAEPHLVVVGTFDNRTGETVLDDSLDLAFRLALEQSRVVKLLPPDQIADSLRRMKVDATTRIDRRHGIEICQREGAKALILGGIEKDPATNVYSLRGEVVKPASELGLTEFSQSVVAQAPQEILGAIEQITAAILTHLGDTLSASEARPLARVTTSNLEALKEYSLGITEFDKEHYEQAAAHFRRAIAIDPAFSMAYAKLGTTYRNLDQDVKRAKQFFQEALKDSERLTAGEELYVRGWVANWKNDHDEMVRIWSLMSTIFKDRYDGHYNLGLIRWQNLYDFEGAAEELQKAVDTATEEGWRRQALTQLGYCQLALGRLDEARQSFEAGRPIETDKAPIGLAEYHVAVRDYRQAKNLLEVSALSPDNPDRAQALLATVLCEIDRGEFDKARSATDESIALARQLRIAEMTLRGQLSRIALLEAGGDLQTLEGTIRSTLHDVERQMEVTGEDAGTSSVLFLALLGTISARSGFVDLAEQIQQVAAPELEASKLPIWRAFDRILEGEILAARGQPAPALEALRQSQEIVPTFEAHEAIARLEMANGNPSMSIDQYRWVTSHRGWVFATCDSCLGKPLNLIAWIKAHHALGMLYDRQGQQAAAVASLQEFLRYWDDDQNPLVESARRKLDELKGR